METSDVRRRLRGAIDQAKRRAADRRAVADEASRVWAERLPEAVLPAFQGVLNALSGEGFKFTLSTPGETARLSPERSSAEFLEIALDTNRELPAVVLRSTGGRGSRTRVAGSCSGRRPGATTRWATCGGGPSWRATSSAPRRCCWRWTRGATPTPCSFSTGRRALSLALSGLRTNFLQLFIPIELGLY